MSRRGQGGSAKAALGAGCAGDLGRGWTPDRGLLGEGAGLTTHAWPHSQGPELPAKAEWVRVEGAGCPASAVAPLLSPWSQLHGGEQNSNSRPRGARLHLLSRSKRTKCKWPLLFATEGHLCAAPGPGPAEPSQTLTGSALPVSRRPPPAVPKQVSQGGDCILPLSPVLC